MNREIPIKNIYYMVLYAFDKVRNKHLLSFKGYEQCSTATDILIRLFVEEVSKITKRGLYRSYQKIDENSLYLRGKIRKKDTIKLTRPKLAISKDYFTPNNALNQALKKTLHYLLRFKTDDELFRKLRNLYILFEEIDLNEQVVFNQKLLKHNSYYGFALDLSYFILNYVIPSGSTGKHTFYDIVEDDEIMSSIYEAFLRNFYKIHTSNLGYQVSSKKYKWNLTTLSEDTLDRIPEMQTDIEILKDNDTKIIIDAKFYKDALSSRYNLEKYNSKNMYQMNAYLDHNNQYDNLRGVLLYPTVNIKLNDKYYSPAKKYTLEFITINLNEEWNNIEENLINLID